MNKLFLIYASSALCFTTCVEVQKEKPASQYVYPATRKDTNVVDDYFGTKVADPYRWLENDTSDETKQWVKAENEVTFGYLEKIPFRNQLKDRLMEIWNYARESAPFKEGPYYFYYRNDGIQNQSVLYKKKGLSGEPVVFLDPNKLSADGTVSLSGFSVSKDAKYAGYSISRSGSDWNEIFVMKTETGKLLPDHLEWIKFSGISWWKDGFFYSRYPAPTQGSGLSDKNMFHTIYYHKLGKLQKDDELIFEQPDYPERTHSCEVTKDGRFLILYGSESTSGSTFSFKDLKKGDKKFTPVVTNFSHNYDIIDNMDDKLIVRTDNSAPKYHVVVIDSKKPDSANWEVLIPEKEEVLESVSPAMDKLVLRYLKDVLNHVYIYGRKGEMIAEVHPEENGVISGVSASKEDSLVFYSFENCVTPPTINKYSVTANNKEIYWRPQINFIPGDYEFTQKFYNSKDGTRIPLFIAHRKGLQQDGNNPTLLYGYGGFNISNTPRFSIANIILIENGGIYALANIRGGGEYGEDWHKAGTQLKKQNVFDDFIAAAEFLVSEKYTSGDRLAVHGRSNGGLLVGAVMTQRPELFKVAFPGVGVLDMLRYHTFTIGRHWSIDYGLSEDETQFRNLYKYSPLHNVRDAAYPATMILTADHDDRVVPAHSFKFAATLQEHQKGDNPAFIRIDVSAGHGAGKPTSKQIEEWADIWAFMFHSMGVVPEGEVIGKR